MINILKLLKRFNKTTITIIYFILSSTNSPDVLYWKSFSVIHTWRMPQAVMLVLCREELRGEQTLGQRCKDWWESRPITGTDAGTSSATSCSDRTGKGKAYRVHQSQALIRALCYKRCTSQKSNYHHKLKGTKSQIYTVEGQKGEQQKQAINKEYV